MWTSFGLLMIVVVVGVVLYLQKTNRVTEWLLKNLRTFSNASLEERDKLLDKLEHDSRDKT
jgi:hypothetical protein